ncbi:hypothetical protein [Saccharicrinis aurantiacus]|uniref:hypothetical protein n=1 Tax=Saccharicrinis aurantiacus TaxID=1849719 RepID=UPI00094F4B75|nr:hypothetical protein [Saccharicrinis aurantiacus]
MKVNKSRKWHFINQGFIIIMVAYLLICCENKPTAKSIEGVWELTNFYRIKEADTILNISDKVQHKIYLDGHVIWNVSSGPDSTEWHGYGTYTFENDTLTEILTSTSIPMRSDNNMYLLRVELNGNNFKQIVEFEYYDTLYQHIELYKKLN